VKEQSTKWLVKVDRLDDKLTDDSIRLNGKVKVEVINHKVECQCSQLGKSKGKPIRG
jgi:hypothetical protein